MVTIYLSFFYVRDLHTMGLLIIIHPDYIHCFDLLVASRFYFAFAVPTTSRNFLATTTTRMYGLTIFKIYPTTSQSH